LVKQFVLSFKGIAFDWYTNPASGSIDSWGQMKSEFTNHFYNMHHIVNIAKLANTSQQNDKLVINYINRLAWSSSEV